MRPPKQAPIVSILISITLLSAFLMQTVAVYGASGQRSPQKLRAILASKGTHIKQLRSQLHAIKAQEADTRDRQLDIQSRLRVSRGQLQIAGLQLERSQLELKTATKRTEQARQNLVVAQQDASERLVSMYERGDHGYLEMLFAASNFSDLLQRAQVAKFIMERDRAALDGLADRRKALLTQQQEVARHAADAARWKEQMALINQQNEVKHAEVTQQLNEVKDTRDEFENELAAEERDSADVAAELQAMYRTPRQGSKYAYSGPSMPTSGLPAPGRITSPFGPRRHPVLGYVRMHTGVDIGAPMGAPISAAGNGEVIFAGRRGGYGNCTIIDHGGGKATLYAHQSAILVRVGQDVTRGQLIGRVGSTGMSTGPHLHYEVRINGTPVNPL